MMMIIITTLADKETMYTYALYELLEQKSFCRFE